MTNKKGTKRSLLMSVLALLLCVSMLIGSTFAWFTDSVTSAGNIIKSGKLDVEMYWADGKEAPASANWKDASTTKIFDYDNWEPGYTEVRHIKIANTGTLALKYQLNILPTGEVSKLADVIDVYFIDPAAKVTDRAALEGAKKLGTLTDVLAGMETSTVGTLDANKEVTVTLALKMREDAGNKYQGMSIGSEFAIQLLATQLTAEFDSFGPDYDEDAALGTYIELPAGADLLAAMASAQADMPLTIKLNGDVKWPTEGHHGENDVTKASSILIDGNGYTITATGAGVTPLGDNNAPMTLKNVKIVDKSVSYKEDAWEFTYLEMGGSSLTCYNVTFADEIQIGTNATFTNCSFESNEESVYAVWVEDGSATFDNCTFTGYRGLKAHEAYGTEVSAVIVKDCVFSNLSKKPGMAIGTLNADTTVSITGSTFINCLAGDQDKYIYETDTDVAKFNFKEENNTVLNNATIVSTNATGLAEAIAKGGVVFIATDIDMNNAWTSVVPANGLTILGNNHTITNLNQPLLAGKGGPVVTVKGLTIADSNVGIAANENGLGTGAFMAFADYSGTVVFEDCHLLNSTVTGDERAAAIIAYSYANLTIKDCSVEGCTIEAVGSTAGLAAHVNGNTVIENSSVKNTKVTATEDRTGKAAVAGAVVGTISNNTAFTNVTASNNTVSNTGATPACEEVGRIVSGVWTVDGAVIASTAAELSAALANGGDVVMANDVTLTGKVITTNGITEAYGNKVGVAQYSGTLDGNGNTLTETGSSAYVIVTHGGTIKNLTIVGGGRGIVIYAPTEDVIIDKVVIDGPGYAINTAEHNGQDLIVTNSTVNGWTSLAGLDSVSFTNCKFGENSTKCWQNYGYGADYDRLIRPYGQTSFTDCTFEKNFYIDLSSLANGNTVTLTNCNCEGVVLTAENYANYITVELPDWATSIADCIVFN